MSLGANLLSIFVPSYFLTVLANVPRSKEGARDVVGCSFRLLNMEFDVFEPFLCVEARALLAHAR